MRCRLSLPNATSMAVRDAWTSLLGAEYPVTKLLAGVCIGSFALMALVSQKLPLGLGGRERFELSELLRWGAIVANLSKHAPGLAVLETGDEPWRVASAVFLHFGLLHVGFNVLALTDLGRTLEPDLRSGRLATAFVVTGVMGFVVSAAWYGVRGQTAVTGGASGAIFGLAGVLLGLLITRRNPAWKQYFIRLALYAAIFAYAFPVNNAAHAGGFVTGVVLGLAFGRERTPWERRRVFSWIGGLLLVASFASVPVCHLSPKWKVASALEQLERI